MVQGTYLFESDYPENYLHFYLFGDGHHSFEQNVIHQYGTNILPTTPVVYYAEAYGPVDPDDDDLAPITQGVASPQNTAYLFDNKVQIKRSWNMVEQQDNYMVVMFENIENPNPISGCIEFHFNSSEVFIDDGAILDDYNNNWVGTKSLSQSEYQNQGYDLKFKWSFDSLEYKEQRMIYIPTWCQLPVLSNIKTMAVMKVNSCTGPFPYNSKEDAGISEGNNLNFYTLSSIVANSPHDPNCIVSDTRSLCVYDIAQEVDYRVYFQNEGVDDAMNVFVYMEHNDVPFNGRLFSYDVTLLQASHDCQLHLDPAGDSFVVFPLIHLPGTNGNPPPISYDATIGWVDLRFCYNLAELTALGVDPLEFKVDIVFDWEAPIPTSLSIPRSTTYCTLLENGEPCEAFSELYQEYNVQNNNGGGSSLVINNETPEVWDYEVAPNPTSDFIRLNLGVLDANKECKIRILDIQNNLIKNVDYNYTTIQEIDVTSLPPSIYFIVVDTPEGSKAKKFIKY